MCSTCDPPIEHSTIQLLPLPRREKTRCRRRMVMANRLWYLEREARVMEGLRGEQNHPASRMIMRDQRPVPCKCIRPSADYFLYHAPRIPSTNLLIPISTLITSLVCLDRKPSFKVIFLLATRLFFLCSLVSDSVRHSLRKHSNRVVILQTPTHGLPAHHLTAVERAAKSHIGRNGLG